MRRDYRAPNLPVATILLLISASWFAVPRMVQPSEPTVVAANEAFDPSLETIDTVDAAQAALPRFIINTGRPQKDVADAIQRFLEDRFVHGFPRFSIRQNWIAYAEGRLTSAAGSSDDGASRLPVFDSPLRPDDILKHRIAMCTQQVLLFEALLARNHIDYARISFMDTPAHDAVAAKVDGVWRFYDSDMEPTHTGVPLRDVLQGDILPALYPMVHDGVKIGEHFKRLAHTHQILVRDVNRYPAARGALLQEVTEFLSRWGWILPLVAGAWLIARPRPKPVPSELPT